MTAAAFVVVAVLVSGWCMRALWSGVGSGHVAARLDLDGHRSRWVRSSLLGQPWVQRLESPLYRRRIDDALIAFAEAASRSTRAGASLVEAAGDAGRAAGPPIADDMVSLRRRIDAGDDVSTAMARWAADRPHAGVRMLSSTCRLGYVLGGPVADGFDSIARALRSRRDVAAEARSLSSQARASAALLLALPVVVGTITAIIDPATRSVLLGTPLGWGCIVCAAGLDMVGLLWMRRLLEGGS